MIIEQDAISEPTAAYMLLGTPIELLSAPPAGNESFIFVLKQRGHRRRND